MIRKYAEIFCWKNVSSFCSAKATHIFSAKNIRILYIESTKTVNEMTLNELVKLTTLWTTGPWFVQSLEVSGNAVWIRRITASDKMFLFSTKKNNISPWKHMLWYSLEAPQRGASNKYHNVCFQWEIRKQFTWYPLLSTHSYSGAMTMLWSDMQCEKLYLRTVHPPPHALLHRIIIYSDQLVHPWSHQSLQNTL